MADNSILTPGGSGNECINPVNEQIDTSQFLKVDYRLGEFESESDKQIARINLGAAGINDVYDKTSADLKTLEAVKTSMDTHLATEDPHNIIPTIESKLEGFVKEDGTTPFLAPQTGVDPLTDFHLTTKRFVTALMDSHLAKTDPHNIIPLVEEILKVYVTTDQIYRKVELYTREQVDDLIKNFVRRDGTTAFLKPQLGVTPVADGHLSTKKYVDDVMFKHLVDADPHGFVTLLNQRLNNYFRKTEIYSRAETYSRAQIDAIINQLVIDAARGAIEEHINQYDPHGTLKEIYSKHYVPRDGSVPFTAPQKGVDAVEDDELVTKRQLDASIVEEPVWITSGPVQTTVGFVEDETDPGEKLNLQEVMDAIFYGKSVDVKAPAYALLGSIVDVELFVRGSTGVISYAELWQNDELIGTYTKDDFELGQLTVKSLPINEETTFTFKVFYPNGTYLEASCTTKVAYDIFVGILPKWYAASNVNYDYLLQLVQSDPENNSIDSSGDLVSEIKHKYNFSSPKELKQIFVAMPKEYPDLVQMTTPSQQFGLESFDIISDIPFEIPGLSNSKIYKIYVFKESLVTLNLEVTFKFDPANI
jgi:hypothetical protein